MDAGLVAWSVWLCVEKSNKLKVESGKWKLKSESLNAAQNDFPDFNANANDCLAAPEKI